MNVRHGKLSVIVLGWVPFSLVLAFGGDVCPVEYADAEFFIEINASAGDAGVQLMLDGTGWNELEMTDPLDNVILDVSAADGPGGSLGVQGLTEFFFESAEPSFEDQTLQALLGLFPEGDYELVGLTTEGEEICGKGCGGPTCLTRSLERAA